ncbi:MAG: phosphate butyryltransferase [Deltaproteobacteria bacterium]|nr:phosphate butyryltransferase [Deltaproteobacteria bacterium]
MKKELPLIRSFADIDRIASEQGPKTLAVLAPEDEEFMLAIKRSTREGIVRPVLIGNKEKMAAVADRVAFDISDIEKIFEEDRQSITDLGVSRLFAGSVDIVSKGQIPTSYVYRSVIQAKSRIKDRRTISVISLWEIPGVDRLIILTDTGVNIDPNFRAKMNIIKNAVHFSNLLGYAKPRIGIISGERGIGEPMGSWQDATRLREAAMSGDLGICEVVEATSFIEMFLGKGETLKNYEDIDMTKLPEILLVPNLDTGNILVKLDFFLDVNRRSLVSTSKGPVIIPSRSDHSESISGALALGVVAADRIKNGTN